MILPFSEKAKQLAHAPNFSLDFNALNNAKEFIESTIAGRITEVEAADAVNEVKKLAVCKAILSLCPYYMIGRFANNYGRLWQKYFRDNPQVEAQFAGEVFPSLVQSGDAGFRINVFEFLNAEESISLMRIENGVVILSRSELSDVLVSQVKRRVMSIPQSPVLPEEVKQVALQLAKLYAPLAPRGAKNLEKPEVKQIRLGVAEGGRYYGCMKLSRACFNDGLSFEEAKQIILEYLTACSQGKSPFTEKEAFTCLEWVYKKGNQRIGTQFGGNAT